MQTVIDSHGYSICRGMQPIFYDSVLGFFLTSAQAPSEAEAQCAELARGGKVFAAGSEDMDTLTFNAPILLRHLTFSEARKMPISEINLQRALEGLEMTMSQVGFSSSKTLRPLFMFIHHNITSSSNYASCWDAITLSLSKVSGPNPL